MKNILIIAHYYYPDVASTGQLYTELAESLLDSFHVHVICTVPSYTGKIIEKYKEKKYYTETINGVTIHRIRVPEFDKRNKISRIRNILSYFFGAIHLMTTMKDIDLIMALSQPPVLGGVLGVIAKRRLKAKLIYNIQDFNPEQILAVNYSKSPLLIKAMMKMDKYTCKKADTIITVGKDLIETVKNRFHNQNVPKTVMINNWINDEEIFPLKENEKVKEFKEKYGLLNKQVFMYSGNIGLYYDLENLIKVLAEFKENRDVVFVFVGEGTVKEKLVQYVKEERIENILFIPYQDKKDLVYSLNAADVHFCVNAKGIKGVSCPSKYYGIAAAGKPAIAVLEEGSEIYSIIEDANSGLLSSPLDYESFRKNLQYAIDHKEEMARMGQNAYEYSKKYLGKKKSIEKYRKCFEELLND